MLSWEEARRRSCDLARRLAPTPIAETVALADAAGRVLHGDALADRDQPPFHRSTRDGYAVRAADGLGMRLCVGEIPAGRRWQGAPLGAGQCVAIMTGAPVPDGADAVVMVEDTGRDGDRVRVTRAAAPGENIVPRGAELAEGQLALARGARLDAGGIALLASLGAATVPVVRRPRVAILTTGDELVPVEATPGPSQIRNSNRPTLARLVARAGGEPLTRAAIADDRAAIRAALEAALAEADVLVLSGGVSAGTHDLVEPALADLGARVDWDGVALRPGRPTVVGEVGGKPYFGLPGNPVSTVVTFELFVRPALALFAGAEPRLPLLHAPLREAWRMKPIGLTLFAPAVLGDEGVTLPPSQGSGDLGALARTDAWAILPPQTGELAAGTSVRLLYLASGL
jgi:molybdopterin molybdotransferase